MQPTSRCWPYSNANTSFRAKTGQGRKSSTLLVQFASAYVTDSEFMAAFAVSKFLYRQDFIQWLEHLASGLSDAKGVADRDAG